MRERERERERLSSEKIHLLALPTYYQGKKDIVVFRFIIEL
jgi:hypothetical protein